MSFFEDIASALDREGIESRVNDEVMFVPITSDLEIQFVEIDPHMPAANVYIAAADLDGTGSAADEEFEAVLVSVVFSVEDAVSAVAEHVATDQVVTVLRDLLEGTDERIADLTFYQDPLNANVVHADVADNSQVQVAIEVVEGRPIAHVTFTAFAEDYEELMERAIQEMWDEEVIAELSERERQGMLLDLASELGELPDESLELGSFDNFDRLFDVLSLVYDHAEDWEAQLVPLEDFDDEEPDVYDIFGEDDDEYDDLDDEEFEEFNLEDEEAELGEASLEEGEGNS